jgi:adhesin/invasin
MTRLSRATSALIATLSISALTACADGVAPADSAKAPARAIAIAGYQQSVVAGSTGADSLAVVVYGGDGELLPGATVQWTMVDGRGSLSASSSVTDAKGIARVAYTAGTAVGFARATATAGGAVPVLFEEKIVAGAPSQLVVVGAPTDTVVGGESFLGAAVRVVDRYGNSVSNAPVAVVVQSPVSGDLLENPILTSDGLGLVSVTFVPADASGERSLLFSTENGVTLTYRMTVVASFRR